MNGMAGAEGGIALNLAFADGTVTRVSIASTRPLRVCRVLVGREVGEALRLLPLLFSVCGTAQTAAGLFACEAALGLAPPPSNLAARALAIRAEAAGQQARRLLVDWPLLLGRAPMKKEVRALLGGLAAVSAAIGEWRFLGGAPIQSDDAALTTAIGDISALVQAAESGIAGCLEQIREAGLAGFGASAIGFLPPLDPVWLEAKLADDGFAAKPCYDGKPAETGALARRSGHPLTAGARADHGNGLLTRLLAQFADFLAVPAELAQPLAADFGAGRGEGPGSGIGIGIGIVETSRGALAHRAVISKGAGISEGRIESYAVLAPTEWNFHPEGALAQGLLGADVPDAEVLAARAHLLVAALDPCVACTVSVNGDF